MLNIKSRFSFLIILLALASCTKEILVEQGNPAPTEEGSRVIAVSFGQQTRTALGDDGLTPEFVGGESVLVSNDEAIEYCTVTISGERASITTTLQGDLTAVYPVRAAKLIKSEKTKGNIIDPDNVNILSIQSGTFADANICMARMKDGEEKMTFHNKTAILKFYVDNSIGVYNLKVKSSDAEIAENSQEITVESKSSSLYEDMPDNQDRRICYVAVKSGVEAGSLMFISHTTTQGCVRKSSTATDVTLEVGKMYNAFIPYYVQVGDQKWGYCNIGAFLPEEPGYCFSWGNTTGYVYDAANKNWIVAPGYDGAGDSYAFSSTNYNKTTGYSLTSDIPVDAQYDAATAVWGNNWRMPKCQEFKTLKNETKTTAENYEIGKGVTFNNTSLFFPEFGAGLDSGQASYTAYSSSSYYETNDARYFYFQGSYLTPEQTIGRRIGSLIRPIYDEPAPVPNVFTVNEEGKRIEFTKGNLYWNGSAWALEANQYDYRTWKGSPACINGEKTSTRSESGTGLLCWTINGQYSYGQYEPSAAAVGSGPETIPFFHESSNFAVGEQQGLYSLSQAEWDYILNSRTTLDRSASKINNKDDARYMWCYITVNNGERIPGLMIFPNYFIWPIGDGAPAQPEVSKINNGRLSMSDYLVYTISELGSLESQGVVFLPSSGWRWPGSYMEVRGVSGEFCYWSSTADNGGNAITLYSHIGSSNPNLNFSSSGRSTRGFAIRLVKNYSAANN